jgi:23S rRNA maturation-related 3'-5' exoribonuclease YhaM
MRQTIAVIRETHAGKIDSIFQVVAKEQRRTQKRDLFISLVLADSTGQIHAKIWKNVENADAEFDVGDVVELRGDREIYKEQIYIDVHRIRRRELKALAPHECPKFDPEMMPASQARDCDGQWILTDASEAVRFATDRKIETIVARLSNKPQQNVPEKPTSKPNSTLKDVRDIVKKYSKGEPEAF